MSTQIFRNLRIENADHLSDITVTDGIITAITPAASAPAANLVSPDRPARHHFPLTSANFSILFM